MASLKLHSFHAELGAVFTGLEGEEIVRQYSSTEAEYHTLTREAGVIDFSFRGRLCALGKDRAAFIHGQVTNDILGLNEGQGCYAALVNGKGRMESDMFAYRLAEEILLDFEPGLTCKILQRLERYIIAADIQLLDVAPFYGLLTIQGPHSRDILTASKICAIPPEKELSWVSEKLPEGDLYIMRNPRLRSDGYDLFVPVEAMESVSRKLNARWCGWDAFEIVRIENAIPRYGQDMDETNLAPEAEIQDRAISYAKGCYIGQEIIARIRTYGKVTKALRLLRLSPPEGEPPPSKGCKLYRDGKEAGYLTSVSLSPKHGGVVALGYVRKEWNQPGDILNTTTPDGPPAVVLGRS